MTAASIHNVTQIQNFTLFSISPGRRGRIGGRLDRRYRLYDTTQDRHLHRYWQETDQAWR